MNTSRVKGQLSTGIRIAIVPSGLLKIIFLSECAIIYLPKKEIIPLLGSFTPEACLVVNL